MRGRHLPWRSRCPWVVIVSERSGEIEVGADLVDHLDESLARLQEVEQLAVEERRLLGLARPRLADVSLPARNLRVVEGGGFQLAMHLGEGEVTLLRTARQRID